MSRISTKKLVSLTWFASGQYLNIPSINGNTNVGSLDKNNIEHLSSSLWNLWQVCTLCNGIIISWKNIVCSYLNGIANPEITEAKISNNSEVPLN
jgi:hypothetical protein